MSRPTTSDTVMTAGFETDSARITGGQVLQPESLEDDPADHTWKALLRDIKKGRLKPSYDSIVGWLVNRDITPERAKGMAHTLARNAKKVRAVLKSVA